MLKEREIFSYLDLLKGRSFAGFVGPAGGHETVEAGRTIGGQRQPFAILQLTDHLGVLHALYVTFEGLEDLSKNRNVL